MGIGGGAIAITMRLPWAEPAGLPYDAPDWRGWFEGWRGAVR